MSRVLGVDHGDRRTGLALSDPLGITSKPLCEIEASTPGEMAAKVALAAREHTVDQVVVGFPRNMDGTLGPRAESVETFVARLRQELGTIPVDLMDERLTTAEARQILKRKKIPGKDQKKHLNMIAAQLILQMYLDSLKE